MREEVRGGPRCLRHSPSSECGRSQGRASGRPIRLYGKRGTIERIEGDDGGRNAGTGGAGDLEECEEALD
jgi:hypothetical protein